MKLLVLAQIPPPVHGQSLMVQTLLRGLPDRGIALHSVPLNLSRDPTDIGRWRPGKVFTTLAAALRGITARFTQKCDTLYYVPAPAKRGALYRDWVIMLLCRPFFKRLVLHFHNGGLGAWLANEATGLERLVTRWLLGRAQLAIVLAESLRPDAEALQAKHIAVVPNGITDPSPEGVRRASAGRKEYQVLFLGLASEEKGLFSAATAVLAANQSETLPPFRLVVAGGFPDAATAERFETLRRANPASLSYAGFVTGPAKQELLRTSDCLCLPSRYPHEGQPLVLLEALAHDLPVIATRWRAIPETLPPGTRLVDPGADADLPRALQQLQANPPPVGTARAHYLAHFTLEHHLSQLAAALRAVM